MSPSAVQRVVLVVLDGLRPDAIPRFELPACTALLRQGRGTLFGRTVSPSLTSTVMASLLTGAHPTRHGVAGGRFYLPRVRGNLDPLPRVLAAHGLPSSMHLAKVPRIFSGVAQRIAGYLGFSEVTLRGDDAPTILEAAMPALRDQRRGLICLHWPDADRAGHAGGWMSPAYEGAARQLDDTVARLRELADLSDPSTLLIALADHGGGGTDPLHHDSDHPMDTTIPILMAGGALTPGTLPHGLSILDIPATICWALGLPIPETFGGAPILDLFQTAPASLAA
jgi:predicted AlkP superfamily pyrophosphatase or phosphodiesterase